MNRERQPTPERGDVFLFWPHRCRHIHVAVEPHLVLSPPQLHRETGLVMVCPIVATPDPHGAEARVLLSGTRTAGYVQCDRLRSFSLFVREAKYVERVPEDVLLRVLTCVVAAMTGAAGER